RGPQPCCWPTTTTRAGTAQSPTGRQCSARRPASGGPTWTIRRQCWSRAWTCAAGSRRVAGCCAPRSGSAGGAAFAAADARDWALAYALAAHHTDPRGARMFLEQAQQLGEDEMEVVHA
ncbi:MAG: hypothetical protein HC914_20350, partial [Chloroflexaceae bacterium]|nr:hypothetical protein [Chloroflexaceae bacterium]